jgi:deaminated glutathione amidase
MNKIAAIQMCSTDDVAENLATAEKLLSEAAGNGALLAILPEMFPQISSKATDKMAIKEDFHAGMIQSFMAEQARKLNIWIVGGTIPMSCDEPTKMKAACCVYDNNGVNVARYDKIHLFDVVVSKDESYKESDSTAPGCELVVVDTPVGKLGLSVCYDIRFPELFTALSNMGAQIIAIPSAFTVKTGAAHWQLLTRARAVENLCYIVGACQGGEHKSGRKTYGHSIVVDPWGQVVSELDQFAEAIAYADIDLEQQSQIRSSLPVLSHRKIAITPASLSEQTGAAQASSMSFS